MARPPISERFHEENQTQSATIVLASLSLLQLKKWTRGFNSFRKHCGEWRNWVAPWKVAILRTTSAFSSISSWQECSTGNCGIEKCRSHKRCRCGDCGWWIRAKRVHSAPFEHPKEVTTNKFKESMVANLLARDPSSSYKWSNKSES